MTFKFTQEVSDVITMLEQENKLIRARNERLEQEVADLEKSNYTLLKQLRKLEDERRAVGGLWEMVRDT